MNKTEVLIIGGGIIGVSAAYFLAGRGVDVTLVERSGIGGGATGACAGSMSLQNKELKAIPLSQEALRVWAWLQDETGEDLEFRQIGGLRVAENDAQLEKLKSSVVEQKNNGLEAQLEIFSGRKLRSFAPFLGSSAVAASYCGKDAKGNPLLAAVTIARAAQSRGAKIHPQEIVQGIEVKSPDCFEIQTSNTTYQSTRVINAAGVWAKNIFNMVNVKVPIRLSVQQAMVTEKVPRLFSRIITHVEGNLTLKQVENKSVLIGGGWKGKADAGGYTSTVQLESLKGNLERAGCVIPALRGLNLLRTWTGLEGRSPDLYPLLGPLQSLPGFYSACCARGGFTMGPVIGKLVTELIVDGGTSFPIEGMDVNRAVQG